MFYVTTMFSALQDTQKNYITASASGSLTPYWEVQANYEPSMGKVHQAMFQGIVKYGFSSEFQQFSTYWSSVTI